MYFGIVYDNVFQFFEFKSFVWMFVIRNRLFVSKIHTQFLTIVHNMFSVASVNLVNLVNLVTASIIQLITKGVR